MGLFALRWLDLPLSDPAGNLRLDEYLLKAAAPVFRIWESTDECVVLGQSGHAERDIHVEECAKIGVPVIRRCSGGGAVVIGPGCLNYSLILPFEWNPGWRDVAVSMRWVMERIRAGLRIPGLRREGMGDLTLHGLKVSGNAQRRTAHAFLHHGTLLYNFDSRRAEQLLKEPLRQPAYRAGRTHRDFLGNLPIGVNEVKARLIDTWRPAPEISICDIGTI